MKSKNKYYLFIMNLKSSLKFILDIRIVKSPQTLFSGYSLTHKIMNRPLEMAKFETRSVFSLYEQSKSFGVFMSMESKPTRMKERMYVLHLFLQRLSWKFKLAAQRAWMVATPMSTDASIFSD